MRDSWGGLLIQAHRFSRATFIGAIACAAIQTLAQVQPPRWIKADDLRVRAGSGLDQQVVGVLQRGSEVILKSPDPFDGFCLIEGDGQYGWVACSYLSAEPIARPRAGKDGIPADRRWLTATTVNLRARPVREAEVVSRLTINHMVRLMNVAADTGYCETQPLDRAGNAEGASGFVACQYLGLEPLPAAQAAGMDDDPVRAFWRAPTWWALENYATALVKRLPEGIAWGGPWPRDEQLERMKAHLALGLKGAPPRPLADWTTLKVLAAAHDPELLRKGERERAWSGRDKDLQQREYRASNAALRLQNALGLQGPLHDSISTDDGGARVIRLVRALELPTIRASLFRNETEIGPPSERAQELAGRFGGIYRTLVAGRNQKRRDESAVGLYDIFSRTTVLTRPVQLVRLYRDGTLRSEATNASDTELLWRVVDPPACEDWTPGFSYGDVDGHIWDYFKQPGFELATPHKKNTGAPRIFAYYARQPPPATKAQRSEQVVKIDRAATGFVRFSHMTYDLNGDGVPDLMVLEGLGPGPGHLGGTTSSDDPWYRLLLANVGGTWKILGHDSFLYGCGC